jgi:ferredoxin
MNNLHATVDKNSCRGCGICIGICHSVFEFDPHGLSEAKISLIDPSVDSSAREAANSCPTNAISLY